MPLLPRRRICLSALLAFMLAGPAHALQAPVGAQGKTLNAAALNNFKIDMPADDAVQFPVIVARLIDGKPMTVREKGPLFIVYPYDTDIKLQSTRYYNRSAWQLRAIEVQ